MIDPADSEPPRPGPPPGSPLPLTSPPTPPPESPLPSRGGVEPTWSVPDGGPPVDSSPGGPLDPPPSPPLDLAPEPPAPSAPEPPPEDAPWSPPGPPPTPVSVPLPTPRPTEDGALGEQLLKGPAHGLARRGAGPVVLAGVAVGLAVVATFALVVDHPGLAGLLGLLAVLAGELARVPPEAGTPRDARAPAGVQLADLVLGGAFVVAAAAEDSLIRVLLGLGVVALLAWLPYLKALGRKAPGLETIGAPLRLAPAAGLWRRPERLGVLMLGPLLGHVVVAQLLVLTVGVFDAWMRLTRLAPTAAPRPGPRFLLPLLTPEGTLQPLVRWGSLALAFLLLLVLPRAEGWRF